MLAILTPEHFHHSLYPKVFVMFYAKKPKKFRKKKKLVCCDYAVGKMLSLESEKLKFQS